MRHSARISILFVLANLSFLCAEPARSLPSFFFRNTGLANSEIRFILESSQMQAAFQNDSVIFRVHGIDTRMRFLGSDRRTRIDGGERSAGKINLLVGSDASAWKTNLATYQRIVYRSVYAGIDVSYSVQDGRLKADYDVAPHADPGQIRLKYENAAIRIDSRGDLMVSTKDAELREAAPHIYQNGRRIEGRFRILDDSTAGFEIGPYDSSQPLIIDPSVYYCTYLGGSMISAVTGVAADRSGNAYLTGWTEALNFPIAAPLRGSSGGGVDAFVVKLNPAGNGLIYATYFGGNGDDRGAAIAVDSSGQAYITGSTGSTNFPVASAIRPILAGGRDAFAAKLNSAGSALIYSTYLGGSNWNQGTAIAVDSSGNAYVAGDTASFDFPIAGAAQGTLAGTTDAFVTKFNASGAIVFSTYLGGSSLDHAGGIAVDASGNVFIAGGTSSPNFPVASAFQPTLSGGQDAFITKIAASGSSFLFSTFLGGTGGSQSAPEQANAVTLDSSGNAYVAGVTGSLNFPTTAGALRATGNGLGDAFAAKVSSTGSLVYSTYLGGSTSNWASGIAVDSSGNAYIVGSTSSVDYPQATGLQAFGGGYDAFISELNSSGSALSYSTFYGGSGYDAANAVALNAQGNLYVAGQTNSVDFPLHNAYQSASNGLATGWVLCISGMVTAPPPPPPPPPPPSGTDLAAGKPANESSVVAAASLGVDGNTDGIFFDNSVTHTGLDANAWWQVDLQSTATITSVVVWGRTDCCSDRLSDYWVFISNTPFSSTDTPATLLTRAGTYSSHQTSAPAPSTTIPFSSAQGRYVRVQLSGTNYLSLAEVQVFGTAGSPPPPPPTSTDLAAGMPATESSIVAPANLAVDGNTDGNFFDNSVTHTGLDANAWWQVDLRSTATITSIVVWGRTDCCGTRLSDYWVFVSNTPFGATDTPATLQARAGTYSSHQTSAPSPSTTIAFPSVQGRYVRVQLSGTNYLSLAEVQVFGTAGSPPPPPPTSTDLASGKPATESSVVAPASLAVDGNTDGNFFDNSVTHTGLDANAWWQVDLQSTATINSVVVWGRTDCCGDRLSDYWVFVSNTPFSASDTPSTLQTRSGTYSSHQTSAPSPSTTIQFGGVSGRYVRVQLSGTNYLSLSELQVF